MASRGRRVLGALVAVAASLPLTGCFSAPPQVVQLNPANGSTSVPANALIKVYFDHAIDRESVATRFSIDPALSCDVGKAFNAARSAPCWVEWSTAPEGFIFHHPGALFAPNTHYFLHVQGGFADTTGVRNELDHRWDITTAPAPRLDSSTPGDGDTNVAIDQPLIINFSAQMDAQLTAAAISLQPAVTDTRVEQNTRDLSRFLLFPGRLLTPNSDYTLVIGPGAADRDGQRIDSPAEVRFHTGGIDSGQRHAVVLARAAGQGPSLVLLTQLAPRQDGEPTYSVPVLAADVCPAASCGGVARGSPLAEYDQAALSADGTRLALVLHALATPQRAPQLVVYRLPSTVPRVVADAGAFPSWSPDGRELCYGAPDGVHVLDLSDGSDTTLPAGAPLIAPAAWSPDGGTLALPVRGAGGYPTVELADPRLVLRYAIPGLTGQATSPAFSPDGSRLALRLDPLPGAAGGAVGAWLASVHGGDPLRSLAADLTPLGWTDNDTLFAVSRPGDVTPQLLRLNVNTGDRAGAGSGPAPSDLASVVLAPGGRQYLFLLPDPGGTVQAWSANIDGSAAAPVTGFAAQGYEAASVGP